MKTYQCDSLGNESQNCSFPDFEIFNESSILLIATGFQKKNHHLNTVITTVHSEDELQGVTAIMNRKEIWVGRTNPLLIGLFGLKKSQDKRQKFTEEDRVKQR